MTAQRDALAAALRACVGHLTDEYTNANFRQPGDIEAVDEARAALAAMEDADGLTS